MSLTFQKLFLVGVTAIPITCILLQRPDKGANKRLAEAQKQQRHQIEERLKEWRNERKNSAANPLYNSDSGERLAKKVVSSVDRTGLGLRLYNSSACHHCNKLRAFLDFYGFSYELVEVHPIFRSKLKPSKAKRLPALRIAGIDQPLTNSQLIASILATFLIEDKPFVEILAQYADKSEQMMAENSGGAAEEIDRQLECTVLYEHMERKLNEAQTELAKEEMEWRRWVEDKFMPLVWINIAGICRADSYNSAGAWFFRLGDWLDNFSMWERFSANHGLAYLLHSKSQRERNRFDIEFYGGRDEMRQAIKEWLNAKGPNRPFMGGAGPGLADLDFYGACKTMAGTWAFTEMYVELKPFAKWFDAMETAVREGRGRMLLERKSRLIEAEAAQQQPQLVDEQVERTAKKRRQRGR